jgi:hypothetical protein
MPAQYRFCHVIFSFEDGMTNTSPIASLRGVSNQTTRPDKKFEDYPAHQKGLAHNSRQVAQTQQPFRYLKLNI